MTSPVPSPPVPAAPVAPRRGVPSSRRALSLLLSSFVVPGLGQLRAGRKISGWLGVAAFTLVAGTVVAAVVMAMTARQALISLLLQPSITKALATAAVVYGALWIGLVLHAWWLGRPDRQRRGAGLGLTLLASALTLAIMWGSVAVATRLDAASTLVGTVLEGGGDTTPYQGRVNILLLGGDAGADRTGMRADSLNVVSINLATGRAVIIGIPRNLQKAPFPPSSPMHKVYPEGFDCPDNQCLINAVNTYVTSQYADRYPGVRYPGVQATKEAVEGVTGLRINYYAMIDLNGFVQLIDAVGGIDITLAAKVPLSGSTSGHQITEAVGPGRVHLAGDQALRLARSRYLSNDYVRMQHQRCIMQGMLAELDPVTVLDKFTDIARAGQGIVATDVPASEGGKLTEVALHTKNLPIKSIALVPPLVKPHNPDFPAIHKTVADAIAASERLDGATPTAAPSTITPTASPSATPTRRRTPTPTPTQTATGSRPVETPKPTSDDLAALCTAG